MYTSFASGSGSPVGCTRKWKECISHENLGNGVDRYRPVIAVPAMVLGLVIWPNPEGAAPTAALIPYFILLALWNGVLLRLRNREEAAHREPPLS